MAGLIRGRFDAPWRCALKFCNGYRAIAVALGGCLSLRLVVFLGPSTVSGNSQLFFLPKLGGGLCLLTLAFLERTLIGCRYDPFEGRINNSPFDGLPPGGREILFLGFSVPDAWSFVLSYARATAEMCWDAVRVA